MTKLEAVYSTWQDIEGLYQKKGRDLSRLNFLRGLTTPSAITKTRKMVMSDFEESEENIERMNSLFRLMEAVGAEAALWEEEIENLNGFIEVIALAHKGQVETISESELNVLLNPCERDLVEMFANRLYRSCYTMEDGKIKVWQLPPNSDKFTALDSSADVLRWMNDNQGEVSKNIFIGGVYALLSKSISEKRSILPITFVAREILDGLDFEESGEVEDVTGKYKTIRKNSFKTNVKWHRIVAVSPFGEERVYVC